MKVKFTLKIILLIFILLNSCDETPTSIDENLLGDNEFILEEGNLRINAEIFNFEENIPQSGYDSAVVYVKNAFGDIVRENIGTTGNFNFVIQSPEKNEYENHYPRNYTSYHEDSTYTITFIDSLIFSNSIEFVRYKFGATIYSTDINNNVNYLSTSINKVNYNDYGGLPKVGDSYYTLYYFKNASTITGYQKIVVNTGSIIREYTTNYNLIVEKGWNIIHGYYESQIGNYFDGESAVFSLSIDNNTSGKWIYNGRELFKNDLHVL
jgi:hypothetical protein